MKASRRELGPTDAAAKKKVQQDMRTLIKRFQALRRHTVAIATIAVIAAALAQSCSSDSDGYYIVYPDRMPNAVVTVKTAADSTVYLQLDDSTTLLPTNMKDHPFKGKEMRAFVNFRSVGSNAAPYTKAAVINRIDSILTKPTAATLGDRNDEVYGNDPLVIASGFPTVCEDNYLTLYIGTIWGKPSKAHLVNLVTGTNADDPYEVELRQNAYGDTKGNSGYTTVAFSLKSLPKTGGKKVKLKVKYQSFEGEKTAEFDYLTKD